MNRITIQGRMTRDAEMKNLGENSVYKLNVAVDRRKGKDGTKRTDFFTCDAWGKTGETISKFFHKGDGIILTGRMESSQKAQDEKTITYWSLVVDGFEFPIGRKSEHSESTPEDGFIPVETPEGLPF